jgi:hypothetical protein
VRINTLLIHQSLRNKLIPIDKVTTPLTESCSVQMKRRNSIPVKKGDEEEAEEA